MWDYHGRGWDRRYSPHESEERVQTSLAQMSWRDLSGAVAIVSELEQCVWHNPASLCRYLGASNTKLRAWKSELAREVGFRDEEVTSQAPEELFELIWREKLRSPISLPGISKK